jgi:hypothetical protein
MSTAGEEGVGTTLTASHLNPRKGGGGTTLTNVGSLFPPNLEIRRSRIDVYY